MKTSALLFTILLLRSGIKGSEGTTEGPSQPPQAQYPLQYPAKIHPHGSCPTHEDRVNLTKDISEFLAAHSCGDTRFGWRRVAYLDMTDPSQSCPPGLDLGVYHPGVRACERHNRIIGSNCSSTFYMTGDAEYTKVCGRVRGYQYNLAFAFFSGHFFGQGIDGNYVSGVSLTHGQSGSRTHIWTFAASSEEIVTSAPEYVCPCTAGSISPSPDFVGSDYFCESGTDVWTGEQILHTDDPLWDGHNCISSCCEFNNPPYFTKTLPTPTTDDIELRLCSEFYDVPIDQVEIYVQ